MTDTAVAPMSPTTEQPATEIDHAALEAEQRDNILSQLETFPYVSKSMLQTGLGPALPPTLWKPVLQKMIEEGLIIETTVQITTPKGVNRTRTVLHHRDYPYPPEKDCH